MNKLDEKALELREKIAKEEGLELDEKTKELLGSIELKTMEYTLADAIREGATVSRQVRNWGDGETACALTAAVVAAKARGYM